MILLGFRRALLALSILALAVTGSAAAEDDDGRGIDPNQGRSLVEVTLPNKAAAIQLQLNADTYGVDFNDHYLRGNPDGSVTVPCSAPRTSSPRSTAPGFKLGTTIEGPETGVPGSTTGWMP